MPHTNAIPARPAEQRVIRRAGSADAAALAQLGAETFTETFGHLYPPEDLAAFLAEAHSVERHARDAGDPAKAVWIVEAGGRAVGYAIAGPNALPHAEATPGCGELKCLYMRREWQGSGVGSQLFAEAIAWLEAAGPRDLWIGVWSENFGAQRFYARHGFEKAGEYGFAVGATVDHEFILRRRATEKARTTG